MKGFKTLVFLMVIAIVVLSLIVSIQRGNRNTKEDKYLQNYHRIGTKITRERIIVDDVRNLIGDCKSLGTMYISIKGKALVWDMKLDSLSRANYLLPSELRANSSDSQITVFMLLNKFNKQVGKYSISHQAAYIQCIGIAVVYWPEKKAVGMGSVFSKAPRDSRPVVNWPEYGDKDYERIASWITALPKYSFNSFDSFVHPLDFKGTEFEMQNVKKYIKNNMNNTYSKIGMNSWSIKRKMEKEEINAFNNLTKVKDRELLDRVIKTSYEIGMCNYTTILMLYDKELNAPNNH
jgi:hypothetical protein